MLCKPITVSKKRLLLSAWSSSISIKAGRSLGSTDEVSWLGTSLGASGRDGFLEDTMLKKTFDCEVSSKRIQIFKKCERIWIGGR